MPEGHTIHRLARDHRAWFAGREVRVSSPQGRFADAATLLDGSRFVGADAHGKHLFHHYDAGNSVHIHLGLFGRFFAHDDPPPAPRPTARYRIQSDEHTTDLVGATSCALLDPTEVDAILARLGPDPIRADADPERVFKALQRRTVGIGQALLDQKVLAGVGNVYRAEVLFVLGIHPDVPARDLHRARFDELWSTLVTWMRRGVREGRIVTVDPDEIGMRRSRMVRADSHYVYQRDICRRCASRIRRYDLAGRWAYVCEICQPRP
ncbi:MAG: DNA-formamidopyrimidine glycosylase family protein [Nitriliruptoraceae bacterium]